MKKRILSPIIFLPLAVAILLTGIFLWWKRNSASVDFGAGEVQHFLVVKGSGASQIGQDLYDKNLIKSKFAFKLYVQITGKADKLQAGEYAISPSLDLVNVVDVLAGPPLELWVTIQEGLRREEMVENFVEGLEMSAAQAVIFREDFLALSQGTEGYLFPDTYLLPRDATAQQVIDLMSATFDKRTTEIKEMTSSSLSFDEIVILASLIEREAKKDEERPLIAGILLNRLEVGMPLQVDATVQYAVASANCVSTLKCEWWPVLTRSDLETESVFNTYKNAGLPPSPIAAPGLASLEAASLAQDTDYLYYIHDEEGQIHYAKTLDEHNQNVRLYLGR